MKANLIYCLVLSTLAATVLAQETCTICGNGTLVNPDDQVSLPVVSGQTTEIRCTDLEAGLALLTPPFEQGGPCLSGVAAAKSAGCECTGVPTAAPTLAVSTKAPTATSKAPTTAQYGLTAKPVGGDVSSLESSEQRSGVAIPSLVAVAGLVASMVLAVFQ